MSRPIPPWPLLPLLAALLLLCQCASHPTPPLAQVQQERWSRVTEKLASAAPRDERGRPVAWHFSIRPAPGINARSQSGGRVEVNSGTLPFVRNDAELAAVLAHEMAHVTAGHHGIQTAETWTNLLAGAGLAAILMNGGMEHGAAIVAAGGCCVTFNLTALAARRREREFEADRLSLDLLRRAGYPAAAAVTFWERYAAVRLANGQTGGRWWQSHPADTGRVQRLQKMAESR